MLSNRSWTGWLTRTAGSLAVWIGSGAVGYSQAAASAPRPPEPDAFEIIAWAFSGSNPTTLVAAVASALGFVASVYQLFGPKPYSAKQGRLDRQHQNDSFATADARQGARHGTSMDGHQRTQAELAVLQAQIATLTATLTPTSPQAAAAMEATLTDLAQSGSEADFAIAQTAVDVGPVAAGDALMAEANADMVRAAERAHQAGDLYAPYNLSKAMAAYKQATELDPARAWSWIKLGRLRFHFGTLADSRACFAAALQQVSDERDRMVLHNEFGNLLIAEGQLGEAREEYESGRGIAERLAAAEPGNAQWQRDLSVSYEKLGNVELAAGDLAAARGRFEAALAIAERLAAAEPGNAEWQRDLIVSNVKLGNVEVAAGDLAAARQRFEAALAIAERLAKQRPDHPRFAMDLAFVRRRLAALE